MDNVIVFLTDICIEDGYEPKLGNLVDYLQEADVVHRGDVEDEDHFVYHTLVVELNGRFIEWVDARPKDNSEQDFLWDSVKFVEKKEKMVTVYE